MENDQEFKLDKGEQTSSFTIGTAGKKGCLKFYFNLDEPLEKLIPIVDEDIEKAKKLTKLEKGLKILSWLQKNGYCQGD